VRSACQIRHLVRERKPAQLVLQCEAIANSGGHGCRDTRAARQGTQHVEVHM